MNRPRSIATALRLVPEGLPERSLAVLFVLGGLLLTFAKIAHDVTEGETTAFDTAVLMSGRDRGGNLLAPVWVAEVARDVTALGSITVLTLLVITLVGYFVVARRRFDAVFLTASALGGTILGNVVKVSLDRTRPALPNTPAVFSASFPSGHATMSAVVFLTIGVILASVDLDRRRETFFMLVAVFLTLLVGVSRVYLGLHYPTDVIAGWCLGSAWVTCCVMVGRLIRPQSVSSRAP